MRRVAYETVLRACAFGSLAIFCFMVGLSFAPRIAFQTGGTLTLREPYTSRLWVADAEVPGTMVEYLTGHGRPIRYSYTDRDWPISTYQNAYATEPGSADATANEALFQRELDSNLAIATQLQLNATPTWIVGDQLLQGQIGYDGLRQAVAKARAAKS